MKKTLIIALLAVLVLGVFTACNGDVNADLSGGKTITFELKESGSYVFDNDTKKMEFEIPSGCTKWGDLDEKCQIKVKTSSNDSTITLTLKEANSMMYFYEGTTQKLYITAPVKGFPSSISSDAAILFGETYSLNSMPT